MKTGKAGAQTHLKKPRSFFGKPPKKCFPQAKVIINNIDSFFSVPKMFLCRFTLGNKIHQHPRCTSGADISLVDATNQIKSFPVAVIFIKAAQTVEKRLGKP